MKKATIKLDVFIPDNYTAYLSTGSILRDMNDPTTGVHLMSSSVEKVVDLHPIQMITSWPGKETQMV